MSVQSHFQDIPVRQVLDGRYRIERTLGRGAFGITYLATDLTLERPVAIKELLPQQFAMRETGITVVPLDDDHREDFEWARARFLDEAKVLARFDHPNIVRIIEYFAENGTAYFVMPYLEGTSLSAVMKARGPFQLADLTALIFPILQGLREVHASHILHRDIKPDNIWITTQGNPVLLDFGAARQAIGLHASEVTTIATASYAPIEQLANEERKFGPYTDIYALGAVIHKAITGELPPMASARARQDLYCPLATRVTHLPRHVLAAVDWALALHEADRPQTVDAWRAALEGKSDPVTAGPTLGQVHSGSSPGNGRVRPDPADKHKSAAFAWVAAALTMSAVIGGGWLLFKLSTQEKPVRTGTSTAVGKNRSLLGRQAGEVRDFEVIKNVFVRCCWCPAGSFVMGNSPDELRELRTIGVEPVNDAPAHAVTVPAGFWIAKYETTNDEWKDIDKALRREIFAPLHPTDPPTSLPIGNVSWVRCAEVCAALDSENPLPGWTVRLPTEQEWEYACRAGTASAYAFGPRLDGVAANCDGNRPFPKPTSGLIENGPNLARVVTGGSYPPNAWGICDLHGNLAEWCQDLYTGPYPTGGAATQGTPVPAGRVTRGGSWNSAARNCRSAARMNERPDYESDTIGFRLVIAPQNSVPVNPP